MKNFDMFNMSGKEQRILSERKKELKELFDLTVSDNEEDAIDFFYWEENGVVSITVIASSLMTCDEAHYLNDLIAKANYMEMDIIEENKIKIYLWFRCWEWVDKN